MKKNYRAAVCAALFSLPVGAQGLTTINPDARVAGWGGIATVVEAGAYAAFDNPSATLFASQQAAIATSFCTLCDKMTYSAAGYLKLDPRNTIEAAWSTGRFDTVCAGRDGSSGGRGSAKTSAVSLGYSRLVSEQIAIGLSVDYARFLRERTGNALSAALSATVSVPFESAERYAVLRLGARLKGLGGFLDGGDGMKLPVSFALGAAYDFYAGDAHRLTLAGECDYAFSPAAVRGVQGAIGVEYGLMQLLFFRAGYHAGEKRLYYPDYGAVGFGVRFMHICFDCSYTIAEKRSPLRNAYSLTLGFDF